MNKFKLSSTGFLLSDDRRIFLKCARISLTVAAIVFPDRNNRIDGLPPKFDACRSFCRLVGAHSCQWNSRLPVEPDAIEVELHDHRHHDTTPPCEDHANDNVEPSGNAAFDDVEHRR